MRKNARKWSSVVVLALLVQPVGAGGDGLAKALRAVIDADSCAFVINGDGAGKGVEGKYQKNMPLYCKAEGIEFFRKDHVLVYKQGAAWLRTRTGIVSDPLAILGASAKVRAARAPREELAVLAKTIVNARPVQGIVSWKFDDKAALELARMEDRDLARSGTAKVWLDGESRLTKYEFTIRILGRRGNADVDGFVTKTVSVDAVNKTKVDVPAAALKALDNK